MDRLTETKIVLVVRRTRLEEMVRRFNTEAQTRFYVEHLGGDFGDYQREDRVYREAVAEAERVLARVGRVQVVDRTFVPNFLFGEKDVVVALGQDGLVANVLKYLDGQPLVGVNPDPGRWEGVLLPFAVGELEAVLTELLRGRRDCRPVTMAKATLNTGEVLYGVNDLFIGPRSHTSARYAIESGGRKENHSSSGVIVSTGLGSTGWFRSVVAGARGIASAMAGFNVAPRWDGVFGWGEDRLVFSVREPWPSTTSSSAITFGFVDAASPLLLTSHMPEHGVIFSDGIEADFLQFNAGAVAAIAVAERKGRLVV